MDPSPRYDDPVSHYIRKTVGKLCYQMKTCSFDPTDLISVLSSLTPFSLECDANRIYERAAIWAMSNFVAYRIISPFNSRMVQSDGIKDTTATVEFKGATLQTARHRFYPEVVNHLLKRYAHYDATTQADAALLRFTQLANMTPPQ